MFPDEVFLTLCCPKAEITEAYSIGETAINIPADAPIPIEIELTSTSLIGDLDNRFGTKPRDLVNGAAYGKYLKIDSAFDVLDTAPGPHPPPSCARNLAGRAQKLSHWHAP